MVSRRTLVLGGVAACLLPWSHSEEVDYSQELLFLKDIDWNAQGERVKIGKAYVYDVSQFVKDAAFLPGVLHTFERNEADLADIVKVNYNFEALPCKQEVADSVINYGRLLMDHLYETVDNIPRIHPIWLNARSVKDVSEKIFVCDLFYATIKVETRKSNFDIPLRKGGGYLRIEDGKWFGAITADYSALFSPYSELIPVINADLEKPMMQETFSEAMANVLAISAAERYVPEAVEIVEQKHREIMHSHPMYRNVPEAIKWINKVGVNEAFRIYRNNPSYLFHKIYKTF
tara:strand:+ start:14106 stop:14972 length:867 start_codon:yes stop_codon:yes gene_type:complete